ncbi:hypothetical protein SLEP1_g13646 [Rubroshorea leprosula]|uniref:Uncharacterized protein n=1 Tax=Rubroshorea leprosula TaxID=152421 RepID=A0AAV5IQG0_9ROSI|nr:hypothetical protein SLEP1_g13646 [Rubroshorea leprosula]
MRGRSRERGRGSGKGLRSRTRWTALGRAYERPIEISRLRRDLEVSQKGDIRNQRKVVEWGYDEGMYKQATAFFFTNFPDEWSYEEMWKTFRKYGRVYAVYSPLRKSRNGKRFGFVRFLEVMNPKVLENQLDKIRVDGCKIWVNLAKYPVEAHETKVSRIPVKSSIVVKGKSYAEAVKGQEKEGPRPGVERPMAADPKRVRSVSSGRLKKVNNQQEWRKKKEGEAWVGMEYNVKDEDCEWLRDCYVRVAHSVEIVPILQERFYMEGYFTCRLRAMGGKMVLMDCEDKEELKDLVQGAASWLSQWFVKVKPWSPTMVAKERFVWLRCLGVPLHVWGPEFFESMVAAWGKFISLDENTSKKRRFDVARILISTSIMEPISVKRQIKVNGIHYNLMFTEEEMSNSLFSMKYDFLPSLKSDTEFEESWSDGLDSEEEPGEGGREANRAPTAGNGDTAGSLPDQKWKNKRVSDISGPEAHFEFEGDMLDDICQKKKDKIFYSWMGEEESVEVVADSLEECLAGSDVGSRDEEVTPAAVSQNRASSNPIEVSKEEARFGWDRPKPNQSAHSQLNGEGPNVETRDCETTDSSKYIQLESQQGIGSLGQNAKAKKSKNKGGLSREGSREASIDLEVAKEFGGVRRVLSGKEGRATSSKPDRMKKKKKKALSCRSVYQKASILGLMSLKKKTKCGSMPKKVPSQEMPSFLPNSSYSVAGGSVGDNGIANCNRMFKEHTSRRIAAELWDFAKQIGVTAEDEAETLRNLEGMEKRDRGPRNRRSRSQGKRHLRELVKKEKVDFLAVQETKLRGIDKRISISVWGTDEVEWVAKDAVGGSDTIVSGRDRQEKRSVHPDLGGFEKQGKHDAIESKESLGGSKGRQYQVLPQLRQGQMEKELYAEEKKDRPRLDGLGFKQLSWEENVNLISPFTEEEIKVAVGECDSSKAPGPNGFNFRFVKSEWDVIKADVVSFLQEFQTNGKLVRGGVREQQMAFLKGRQLMDGVAIANEVIDEAKKKRQKAFLFKIDFEKAYDTVSWSFLNHMMQKMGFCEKWSLWIQECLQSSLVSILVNGSPSRQFKVSRGLRQGDPLSPFLFFIIAKGLNGLVTEAVKNGKLKGVEVGNRSFSISHLQYADDTILFGRASEENVWAMKGILRAFELVSGLEINFNKSQLVGIGVEDDWLNKMSWVLCCKKGTLPIKYLGITIGGSCKSTAFWKPMVDIFERKLASWKGRYLCLGGRITLINSVLSSLPVFWMSMYLIPKGTILLLDKICRKFLWGGAEGGKRINWVKWENVCKEKHCGGLGVKDLRKFNLALLGKWWGRLVREDKGLWGKVIFENYGKVGEPSFNWLRESFNYGSAWWRDICRLSDMENHNKGWLADGLEIRVGDGKDTSFWWDEWCGGESLANKFPRLYLISAGKDKKISQMGNWQDDLWKWDLMWRRNLFSWEEQQVEALKAVIQDTKIE